MMTRIPARPNNNPKTVPMRLKTSPIRLPINPKNALIRPIIV